MDVYFEPLFLMHIAWSHWLSRSCLRLADVQFFYILLFKWMHFSTNIKFDWDCYDMLTCCRFYKFICFGNCIGEVARNLPLYACLSLMSSRDSYRCYRNSKAETA